MMKIRRAHWTVLWLPLLVLTAGCYDKGDLCGSNQTFDAALDACVCNDNAVLDFGQCYRCGANEEVVQNSCECVLDYARDATGMCTEVPDGLGMDCASSDECIDSSHPSCRGDEGGYCTSEGCSENQDCSGGYSCATWDSTPYCRRPPTGLGEACSDQSDCEGLEANVCFPLTSECVTELCSESLNDCAGGYFCCDVSALDPSATTLCVPDSLWNLCPANQ